VVVQNNRTNNKIRQNLVHRRQVTG
jgi:hypothetical protein